MNNTEKKYLCKGPYELDIEINLNLVPAEYERIFIQYLRQVKRETQLWDDILEMIQHSCTEYDLARHIADEFKYRLLGTFNSAQRMGLKLVGGGQEHVRPFL